MQMRSQSTFKGLSLRGSERASPIGFDAPKTENNFPYERPECSATRDFRIYMLSQESHGRQGVCYASIMMAANGVVVHGS
jgi:hypothetical protein